MDERKRDDLAGRAARDLSRGRDDEEGSEERLAVAMNDPRLQRRFARSSGRMASRRALAGLVLPLAASACLAIGAVVDTRPQRMVESFGREWNADYDTAVRGCLSTLSAALKLHYNNGGK